MQIGGSSRREEFKKVAVIGRFSVKSWTLGRICSEPPMRPEERVTGVLACPKCSHPLTELGFLYSGNRLVPREIAGIKGFEISGSLKGIQYGCLKCKSLFLLPRDPSD
jgi:hypothetical protein